jgi:hypothetical protein
MPAQRKVGDGVRGDGGTVGSIGGMMCWLVVVLTDLCWARLWLGTGHALKRTALVLLVADMLLDDAFETAI